METPTAPAEALLIDSAQKSVIPKLSMRKAAEMAGISEGRWRQIVKGYQGTGTGRLPVVAPDETVARMALVVGVTADQLEDAGRPDAATVLRHLLADSERLDVELSEVSTDRLLGEIRRRIEGASYVGSTAEQGASSQAGENKKTEGDLVADQTEDGPGGAAAKRLSGRMSRRVREASEQQREVE